MNRLDFGLIFKRSSCLNSTESKIDSEKIYTMLENGQLESIKHGRVSTSLQNNIDNYINTLSNRENASEYWYRGLELIQKLDENECFTEANRLTDQYVTRVLPYVENVGGVLEFLDRYELEENQENKIKIACEQFKLADKINNNHKQISKRFNIEYEIKSVRLKGLSNVVETCCSMIDTYSHEPYQKLNMCIEEMVYLFEKNNIDYREDELISSILEYFLLRSSNLSDRDIKGYKYVMEHNQCIDDTSASRFLFEDFEVINIKSAINDYLKIQNKTPEITSDKFINIIKTTSIEDLKNNVKLLIDFLYILYTSQTSQECGMSNMMDSILGILFAIVDRYNYEAMNNNISRDDVVDLIAIIERKMTKIPVSNIEDPLTINKIEFKNMLSNLITEKLSNLSNSIYSKDNLKTLDYVNSDEVEEVALREFKIFKFNNIIKATINLDNYLKSKIRNIFNKYQIKIKLRPKKIKNILFDENNRFIPESIYSFIGDDNKIDICLCQLEVDSEDEISNAIEELSVICKEFNDELNNNRIDNVKSYYLINGCIAELHIKDSTKLILTEEEQKLVNEAYKPELDVYIDQLSLFEACNVIAEGFEDKTLDEKLSSIFTSENINFTLEAYDATMDVLSLLGVSKYQVDNFTEAYSNYRNSILTETADIINENRYIKSIYNNWKPMDNVSYDIQIEAYQLLNDIIQEAAPKINKPKVGGAAVKSGVKSSNNSKSTPVKKPSIGSSNKEKDDEYNPSSSISNKLNNLKIYAQGLKSKVKDLGQKEKELSRNLDASYNNFAKAIKNAFISDRREAIIKGSVIPSFSKSIKIAIGLAGLGIVTQNPIVPLVAALGGLAVSKKLTKRERILLLDEIETELEVVEKEIANADAKNQIKKYRALLQYKKDLQRQYQRIKYNVRVGKDILPGSAAGFKERN